MTEVFSTAVAMEFTAEDLKRKKFTSNNKKQKPKETPEEREVRFNKKIEDVVNKDGGHYIEFTNGVGLLVAGAKDDKNYYFVWLDRDRKVKLTDIRSTFHLIREVPISMSITDYLLRNDRKCLVDIVEDFFQEDDTIHLIGRINLGRYFNNDKKSNKNKKLKKKSAQKNNSTKNNTK